MSVHDAGDMVVGHLGVAYLAKAGRPSLPLAILAVGAYGPDLARLVLTLLQVRSGVTEFASHSIPAVLVIGVLIAAFTRRRSGGVPGAAVILAVCLLHWPADVFTGCKPVFGSAPWIGFFRYRHPAVDLPVELGLFVLGWYACRRADVARGHRAYAWWVPAIAAVVQVAFLASLYANAEFFVGNREWTWHPGQSLFALRRVGDPETLVCR